MQIAADWPWRVVLTTSQAVGLGVGSFALPAQTMRVLSVFDRTHDDLLRPLFTWEEALGTWPEYSETVQQGEPSHYFVAGSTLHLFPWPDAAITLEIQYQAGQATMASISDVPVYPEMYHHMLVDGALARAYTDDGNPNQAQLYTERFMTTLERMKVDLVGNLVGGNQPLSDDWWS